MTTDNTQERSRAEFEALDKMEALAKSATPGPWELNRHGAVLGGPMRQYTNGAVRNQIAMTTGAEWMRDGEQQANSAFIAAANPAAILQLIALARAGLAAMAGQESVTCQPQAAICQPGCQVTAAPAAPTCTNFDAWWGRPNEHTGHPPSAFMDLFSARAAWHAARVILAAPTAAVEPSLHNAIMNLPYGEEFANFKGHPNTRIAYKIGHRDARHAAAELVRAPTTQKEGTGVMDAPAGTWQVQIRSGDDWRKVMAWDHGHTIPRDTFYSYAEAARALSTMEEQYEEHSFRLQFLAAATPEQSNNTGGKA